MNSLSIKKRFAIFLYLRKRKLQELIRFDSKILSFILSFLYIIIIHCYFLIRNIEGVLINSANLFRHTRSQVFRNYSTNILLKLIQKYGLEFLHEKLLKLSNIDDQESIRLRDTVLYEKRPFDKRLIILSPPRDGQMGVMLFKFNKYFKYIPELFDLDSLGKDYILILEPSGTGYFDPYILCLYGQKVQIIVQAAEKVDFDFIQKLNNNFLPINIGANSWVDNRAFYPINNSEKIYDVIMISIWSDFKRHYHLFEALSKTKNKSKINIVLIGKPYPWKQEYIEEFARYYGVHSNLTIFENIEQKQINQLLNKSKVYILLSKKEGFNKAIIEAMHANIPGFILEGFNYGDTYEYINTKTGGIINPKRLHIFLDNINENLSVNNYQPEKWVKENMNANITNTKLIAVLEKIEENQNIKINKQLRIKINNPDCDYLNEEVWNHFKEEYGKLSAYLNLRYRQ